MATPRSLLLAAALAVPPLVAQTYPDKDDPRSRLAAGRDGAGIAIKDIAKATK